MASQSLPSAQRRDKQDGNMKKLGLIVNPIAGMGGRVGLKGTDGLDVYQQALELGAKPQARHRAVEALEVVARSIPEVSLVTCAGQMGEDVELRRCLSTTPLEGIPADRCNPKADDTRRAALEMQRLGVDLLLFAGGDGTARDICEALRPRAASSTQMPALGIPAGVKMHSGVFALSPRRAGEIASKFLLGESGETVDAEVMDIDENAFRDGRVSATLHGYLRVPLDSHGVQSAKSGASIDDGEDASDIAQQVISAMIDDTLYIIGPGATTAAIPKALGIPNTLLGVDVVLNQKLLAADATESELLRLTESSAAKIVVSVIGGQGYILGRGNQQISPNLIRQIGSDNIIVVATRRKILALNGRPLLVDTGDSKLDEELSGYIRVVTGFRKSHIYRVSR